MSFARIQKKLGPGLMFAAAAVGTSHLVQSTRAGTEYGLTFAWIIVFICLLKYPLFRFGAEYAAATGQTLIEGYSHRGKWLVILMAAAILIEGVGAIAGVSLVTSGIAQLAFGTNFDDFGAATALMIVTALIVAVGRYHFIENITKVFVVLFAILTLGSAIATLSLLLAGSNVIALPLQPNREAFGFVVAVTGWMPSGNVAAILLAAWVCAKAKTENRPIPVSEARFDFNVGYCSAMVLALCFVMMGTAVLLGSGQTMPAGSVGFDALLIDIFATSLGEWAEWAILIAALAVMYSTLLAIIDGFPRLMADIARSLGILSGNPKRERTQFIGLLATMITLPGIVLGLFLESFTAFIDLVTTVAFIVGPIVSGANHVMITGKEVALVDRPPKWLLHWNIVAVVVLTVAALVFLYLRIT